jgi:hypothetical protein
MKMTGQRSSLAELAHPDSRVIVSPCFWISFLSEKMGSISDRMLRDN